MMIGATMMGSASPSALGSSNVASSSRLPSSSPIPPRHHPSSMSPAHYHGSLGRGAATPSLDAGSRAASSAKGSMKLGKAASPSLPIDHDFVVQAANPNHPEHQRWLESFAPSTSSRRRKSDSNPAGSEASPARRKPSRTDLANGSARSREASDNVALASDSASRTSHLGPPRSGPAKGSRGSDSHGRRLGVATSTGGATNSSDSSADDVAAAAIRPTSPYRSRRRPAAEPRAEDTQTTPAKGSLAVHDAVHGNGSPAERRRKKKRDRSKRREAPAPPMPPPRISSSVNYQAFQSPFIDADSPQQAYEAPMPAMPDETAQSAAQDTTQPPAAVAAPSQVSEPKFKPRSRPQPSQSDIQLLRDAGIGPEVPSKDQTLPLRLASRPPAQQQQGLPSLPPRHPGRQAAPPQAATPSRLVPSPTASRRPHEETSPQTSRDADEPEPRTMPRQRSTSFDMLRQAVGFSPTTAFADGGPSSKAAPPETSSGSRIRASLDGVRPRFLTFTRGGSVPPDDASEADSSVAGGSARAPSSSSARGGKKLRNLFSSLKLGSSSKGSTTLSRHNNVSASTLPIDDASAEGIDRSRGHSEPAQYAPRSTQSMDLPRPSSGTMAGAGRSESPAMASLPGQYNTVDAALGPMAAWGKSSKARLSLVGEETEEDSDHPRKSLGISAAERERATRQAAVAPPSPIAEVNEATRGAIGFPTKSSSSRYDARPDRSPSNSTRSVARSRAETPYDAQSPMSNKTPKEGSSDTFGRKNRLAALWARGGSNASSSRRERSETVGSDGVTQKEILVEWERASSTVSLRMASGHRGGHSQGDSLDASASLADSCDTTGTTGLGIVAMEPSNADSPVIDSLPPAPSGSGWRSRVPSLASIKSARRARSQQYLREAASTPAPPPLPTSPGQQFGPSTPASAVPSVQASANGSVGSDELWRRNLLAEAVSLSLDNANGGAKSVTVADTKPVASPRSPTSSGPTKGKRTPLLEVVAAGRKSFSRDRGKSKGLDAPDESVPTIHKTLGPALLSDLASQDGHGAREEEEEQSLEPSAFYSDDDLEPWDGMDDEAAPASRLAAAPRKPSVGGTPTLEGIAEQDTTSTEGSRSQSQPSSHRSPPLAPGATSSSTTSPPPSMPASSGAQMTSTTPATTPNAQTVRSFSGKRASMGKTQSPPPQLQLHSPYNTPFRSPAGGAAAAETAGDSGRFDDFVAPSPTQMWSRSPSQPTAPSSSGRRTPRSVNRLFSSSSQQARNTPSPSPGGVSPSPNSRTSFSTDRDRAPVASPYVQHQGLRSGGKQPSGGIKGALKKLAPGASPASNGSSSPIGRGISSEQFSQQQQQQRLSFGDSREDLLPEDSSPEGGALAGRPRFQPSPSSLSGLRDPWDDSLASAQAATRMLEVESETLQPSPRTPQRYGGNGNGGAPWSAGGGGGDQVSIHSSLSSRSDFFPGGASGAEDTASDPRSATPAAMAMNRGMMSSASSLQAAIAASSGTGHGNGSANFMSRSTSASDVHDPATTTAPLASHHEGPQPSPQTPSRSSAAHATFYTPPTAQSMLPTSSLASMPSTSSAASASASTSASASASLSGSTSSQSHTNFLPSPSNSSQVSLSLSQHQQMQQPTTPTAADPLEALFRQQKAREAEMLRSISERSRKVMGAQGGQGQGQGGTPPPPQQQRGQQRV